MPKMKQLTREQFHATMRPLFAKHAVTFVYCAEPGKKVLVVGYLRTDSWLDPEMKALFYINRAPKIHSAYGHAVLGKGDVYSAKRGTAVATRRALRSLENNLYNLHLYKEL